MELKLKIRQHIDTDPINGQQYYYVGTNPTNQVKTYGALPALRQWRNFNRYLDVTNDVSDLNQLTLTYTSDRDSSGQPIPGGLFAKKAASGGLVIEGEAYRLVKKWLIEDNSARLNFVDVRIEHVGCGNYDDYVIKATDIEVCDNDLCQLNLSLKQKDDAFTCIQNTLITDNWQGWFPEDGRPQNKKHPRFSYCNEVRPNGLLITLWWLIIQFSVLLFLLAIFIVPIVNTIIVIIKIIIGIINAIISFINALGANINPVNDNLDIITLGDVQDIIGNFFVESSGCGREHPAPLIRDYISNVCSKCGVTVNDQTAALFYAQTIEIETSIDRQNKTGKQWRWNPHYNACYFTGTKKRGIRRFITLNIFAGATPNLVDWWINDNAPFMTLDMFLDSIKTVYNLDWRVRNNTLYIQRKDYWIERDYVFDFNGADKNLIIDGICYNWTGANYPAIIKGIYSGDGADVCGNEAQSQQDGIVGLGATDINPLFKGVLDKTTQFGAAKFRLDGASTDYLFDAMQQVLNTQFIGTNPASPVILRNVYNDYINPYADYALLLRQETSVLPKILIWDGGSFDNAKCVRGVTAHVNGGAPPSPNLRYNNYQGTIPWHVKHEPLTKVLGDNLTLRPNTEGVYTLGPLAGAVFTRSAARLVNYPMYFEPGYADTLWDWFHWIDDPLINPQLNREWSAKIELCCDALKRIKPFNNGKDIVLGQKVKLPNNLDGKITEINISYKTNDVNGMFIEMKGVC